MIQPRTKRLFVFLWIAFGLIGSQSTYAGLIIGGTATFTFDQSLSGALTPLNNLNSIFKGTQSYADVLAGNNADLFDSISGSLKTVTFSINGASPAAIVGRPNNAPTTLDYNSSNVLGSWTQGTDAGAFLSDGEQIGIQGMTRWNGNFNGNLLFGDFTIRYAPGRTDASRSGLVLVSNIDFANATYADLANINMTATDSALNISGDLLYSNGLAMLTGDINDVGVRFGTFQINAITAVPEPSSIMLVAITVVGIGLCYRRKRALSLVPLS